MPATKPDVWFSTWNVWATDVIVPLRNASIEFALERSAALMPPGNIADVNCRFDGATPALKPVETVGNRPA